MEKLFKNIKKYDVLIYYELIGLGNNLDYFRKILIIFFVNLLGDINLGNKVVNYVLNNIFLDLEESIISVVKRLGKVMLKRIKVKIV